VRLREVVDRVEEVVFAAPLAPRGLDQGRRRRPAATARSIKGSAWGLTANVHAEDDLTVSFEVEFRNVAGDATAIGSAGPYALVVDRPAGGGGRGQGFNGGQLLYLAIGGCVSNDLFREASARGISLSTVRVVVRGDFAGDPAVSEDVSYEVEVTGNASSEQLRDLVSHVDAIAEIPNSVRRGTPVNLTSVKVTPA